MPTLPSLSMPSPLLPTPKTSAYGAQLRQWARAQKRAAALLEATE